VDSSPARALHEMTSVPEQNPAPAPKPRELVVATYNIAGHTALQRGDYVAEIAAVVRALEADVVGLQEVHRGTWQSRWSDQIAALETATGMKGHLGPSFHALGGDFGNAVLTRGEIVDATVLKLPRLGEPRTALRARLSVDGLPLELYVTHLTAWGELNRWIRRRQVDCLCGIWDQAPSHVVFMGDLNAGPSAPELNGFRARGLDEKAPATHAWTGRALDAIVVGPGWELVEKHVVRTGPSDHWPVVARLRWRGEPPKESLQ
jgi:endonuclease/exonuclease/phosphatase family metal-dependent hydrolase